MKLLSKFKNKTNKLVEGEKYIIVVDKVQKIVLFSEKKDGLYWFSFSSGYTVGFRPNEFNILSKIETEKSCRTSLKIKECHKIKNQSKKILVILTGGTICSRGLGKGYGVSQNHNFIRTLFPEDQFYIKEVFKGLDSTNIGFDHWNKIGKTIESFCNEYAPNGVLVLHGTDTLQYTSAALLFGIETNIPIVLTGSQRSPDRPSSDAFQNINSSIMWINEKIPGVTICMANNKQDEGNIILNPARTIKINSSKRNAFKSIGVKEIARISPDLKITYYTKKLEKKSNIKKIKFSPIYPLTGMIHMFPGYKKEQFEQYLSEYNSVIVEGYGFGHVPSDLITSIKDYCNKGNKLISTSLCLEGHSNLNIYSLGIKMKKAGMICGKTLLPYIAWIKQCWIESNKLDHKILLENLHGEFLEKIDYDNE